ncbi:MAG TPA: ferritin-like domain-containing protein [Verrucomicrobiae bacterium]|jgi:bacterioferritin (cytochrome b1)|nr:ferritin-like domain-containing protein [Verrucomicrobiae bacterium]
MPVLLDLEQFLEEVKTSYDVYPHGASFRPDETGESVESSRKLVEHDVTDDGRQAAIGILRRQYAEEIQSIIRLQRHAAHARYSQFTEGLRKIAKEEQRHAQLIVQRIHALGGKVPKVSGGSADASSGWRALSADLDAEKRCCAELAEELAIARDLDDDTRILLDRILQQEKKHLHDISAMQMRSDPQAEG